MSTYIYLYIYLHIINILYIYTYYIYIIYIYIYILYIYYIYIFTYIYFFDHVSSTTFGICFLSEQISTMHVSCVHACVNACANVCYTLFSDLACASFIVVFSFSMIFLQSNMRVYTCACVCAELHGRDLG